MKTDQTRNCIAFQSHDHGKCQRKLLSRVSELCESRQIRLTKRRQQVFEILLKSHQPMGAYEILGNLNRPGDKSAVAPPIVYRALEFLLSEGLVHRIESKNAFISCDHPGHETAAQFLICQACDKVAELENQDTVLLSEAQKLGFSVDHSVVEISGICAGCQKNG